MILVHIEIDDKTTAQQILDDFCDFNNIALSVKPPITQDVKLEFMQQQTEAYIKSAVATHKARQGEEAARAAAADSVKDIQFKKGK